ncbi:DUF202 domain-containing protein [Micromonospora sp. NPDC049679]|uniref:DUF202 domain-containing protein n=1 Tax=Micromonospora sp. NPDC049679 TaxID=3155920 RepID=UPI0033DF386C
MTRDPGLQAERTRLAWRRTALTLTAVTVLTLRLSFGRGAVGALLAAAALLGWAAVVGVGHRRIKAMATCASAGRALPLSALVIAGYAAIGTLLVITGLGSAPR